MPNAIFSDASDTAGVVINPRSIDALRNLVVTVDYFDIKIKDAIVSTPLQFILDQCYGQSNTDFCDFIVRRPGAVGANSASSLDEVNSGPSNSGGLRTSGIDTTIAFRFPALGGNVSLKGAYTNLFKGFAVPLPGSARDQFAGEIGAAKDRFTANVCWENEEIGFNVTGTYIRRSSLDDQLTGARPGSNKLYNVGAQFYLDSQIRFKVADEFEFYAGADNILNNKPPFLADIGASAGIDTDIGTYDTLGRRFYAGARVKF